MFTQFERRHEPLISVRAFLLRMSVFGTIAFALDALLVVAGALGFHGLEHTSWLSSALNAAMILTGNGPVHAAASPASQLFQIVYAVIGGITFVIVVSVILAPVVHRVLHNFHLGVQDAGSAGKP